MDGNKDHEKPAYSRHGKVQYEHCPGYTDKFGIWNNGFNCPRWGASNEIYCCGNERERNCCLPTQQHQADDPTTTTTFGGSDVLMGNADQPSPPVMVPVLMIATGAGIVLAIIVVIATVCLCCLFCRCCKSQKSKFFKPNQKVDLMNLEAAKITSAIETQAMTSSSRPRTPSSVHMATKIVDISHIKESRFSFSAEEEENTSIMDALGTPQIGKWNGPNDIMKKSSRDLEFINLPPIADEQETPNFYNENFRLHDSIMTTSDYHSSSPLTGHATNQSGGSGGNSSGGSSATLGRHQQQKQRCHLHQHQSSISSSSCLPHHPPISGNASPYAQQQQPQQSQLASVQSQGAMKKLTFDLLHSLSPGLHRHYGEPLNVVDTQLSPYLASKFSSVN